jgi:hypothetical protein
VAAGSRAPSRDCAFGAYARAALSGRKQRAKLDAKRRFTAGAAFLGSEACAPRR